MKKAFKIQIFFVLILFSSGYLIIPNSIGIGDFNTTAEAPPAGYKVLMFVASGFGVTYFHAKEQFELWNWIVETAGSSESVTSCYREDPQQIQSEYLISAVNRSVLSHFDCLFVPSGGHWESLSQYPGTLELISTAHKMNLIVASLCVGKVVLARSGILKGVKIAYDANVISYIQDSGAIMVAEEVVSHRFIVTGGPGGGLSGGGASAAPTLEVCQAIADAIQKRDTFLGVIIGISSGVGGLAIIGILFFYIKKRYLKRII